MRTDDSHLAKQAENASIAVAPDDLETQLPDPLPVVPVRALAPALATWRTVILSANNPVLQALRQDPRRAVAWLMAVDNPVFICESLELAQQAYADGTTSVQGAYLPVGVPVPAYGRAACWAAATTTATTSRIAVHIGQHE